MDQQDIAEEAIENEEDGEVIEGEEVNESPSSSNAATVLLSLEELIKNHIDSIDKLRLELRQQKEMYEDSFVNNPTYREHVEKVKEANKSRLSVRQNISKQPSVAVLEQKVKDLRFDIGEQNRTLSDLLQDYREQTGATQIETRAGQVLEIVSTAKLVRKK